MFQKMFRHINRIFLAIYFSCVVFLFEEVFHINFSKFWEFHVEIFLICFFKIGTFFMS